MERIHVDAENELFVVGNDLLLEKKKRVTAYPSGLSKRKCEIPSGEEAIGAYSFFACQFDMLVFPNSIKRISEKAVCSCGKLRCVEVNWQNPQDVALEANPFYEMDTEKITMKMPKGTKALYVDLFNSRMGYRFRVIEKTRLYLWEGAFNPIDA